MAKNKTDGPTKSDHIRDYLAANPGAKASEVVKGLAEKDITVTNNLVYFIMSKAKDKKRRQKREKAMAVAATTPAQNGDALTVIRKVKGLASEVGGMKKLRALVEALSE